MTFEHDVGVALLFELTFLNISVEMIWKISFDLVLYQL